MGHFFCDPYFGKWNFICIEVEALKLKTLTAC
jgi:hypothetical protein